MGRRDTNRQAQEAMRHNVKLLTIAGLLEQQGALQAATDLRAYAAFYAELLTQAEAARDNWQEFAKKTAAERDAARRECGDTQAALNEAFDKIEAYEAELEKYEEL